jgi:hypothetical protein
MKRRALFIGVLGLCGPLILGAATTRAGSPGPVFSDTGPEAAIYGAARVIQLGSTTLLSPAR